VAIYLFTLSVVLDTVLAYSSNRWTVSLLFMVCSSAVDVVTDSHKHLCRGFLMAYSGKIPDV